MEGLAIRWLDGVPRNTLTLWSWAFEVHPSKSTAQNRTQQ